MSYQIPVLAQEAQCKLALVSHQLAWKTKTKREDSGRERSANEEALQAKQLGGSCGEKEALFALFAENRQTRKLQALNCVDHTLAQGFEKQKRYRNVQIRC